MYRKPLQAVRPFGLAPAASTNAFNSASQPPAQVGGVLSKPRPVGSDAALAGGPGIVSSGIATSSEADSAGQSHYFSVLWTADKKKHQTYDDGVLTLDGRLAQLFNTEGRLVSKEFSRMNGEGLSAGSTLSVGRNEVEVANRISREHYESGRIFSSSAAAPAPAPVPAPSMSAAAAAPAPAGFRGLVRPSAGAAAGGAGAAPGRLGGGLGGGLAPRIGLGLQLRLKVEDAAAAGAPAAAPDGGASTATATPRVAAPAAAPLVRRPAVPPSYNAGRAGPRPRHDPLAPNALVLYTPPQAASGAAGAGGAGAGAGAGTGGAAAAAADVQVPVVVDPLLSRCLRPHQREGVAFMYRCVALGDHGCILADDMGLGKTLQSIALLWTLLKQSPRPGVPHAHKAIVVCPSSLVLNWRNEFKRWLGDERCIPIAVRAQGAEAARLVSDFMASAASVQPVLIVSYEMLRKHVDLIVSSPGAAKVGALICDEGHRLKASAGNKTIDALARLPTRRRVLLTGTPVQNNLEELYAMVSFVAPGALGDLPTFKRVFQQPITAGRDRGAAPDARRMAAARSAELSAKVSRVLLRRTAEVQLAYLPPKSEAVVFLRMAPLQAALYRALVACRAMNAGAGGGDAAVLRTLNALRKACMHPDMLLPTGSSAASAAAAGNGAGATSGRVSLASGLLLDDDDVDVDREAQPEGEELDAGGGAGAAGKKAPAAKGKASAKAAALPSAGVAVLAAKRARPAASPTLTSAAASRSGGGDGTAAVGPAAKRARPASRLSTLVDSDDDDNDDEGRSALPVAKRKTAAASNDSDDDDDGSALASFIDDEEDDEEDDPDEDDDEGTGDTGVDAEVRSAKTASSAAVGVEFDDEALEVFGDGSDASAIAAAARRGGWLPPGFDRTLDPVDGCLQLLPPGYRRLIDCLPPSAVVPGRPAPGSAAARAAAAVVAPMSLPHFGHGAAGGHPFLAPAAAAAPVGMSALPLAAAFEASIALSSKLTFVDRLLREMRIPQRPAGTGPTGLPLASNAGAAAAGNGGPAGAYGPSTEGSSSSSSASGMPAAIPPHEKVVLVSNYTSVLDLLQALCEGRRYSWTRLDGSTPAAVRGELVTAFNKPGGGPGSASVFLLSSQAGGVGLNLVAASRLVLMDSSWNPALDKQALARVWRDGQRRHTFIYRLVASFTMEEKVLQRQLAKEDLGTAAAMGGSGGGGSASSNGKGGDSSGVSFSRAELRELFAMDPDTPSGAGSGGSGTGSGAGSGAGGASGGSLGISAPCDTYRAIRTGAAMAKGPAVAVGSAGRRAGAGVDESAAGGAGALLEESEPTSAAARVLAQWVPWAGPDAVAEDAPLRNAIAGDSSVSSGSASTPGKGVDFGTAALLSQRSGSAPVAAAISTAAAMAAAGVAPPPVPLATYVMMTRVNHPKPAAAAAAPVTMSAALASSSAGAGSSSSLQAPAQAQAGPLNLQAKMNAWAEELEAAEASAAEAAHRADMLCAGFDVDE